MVPQDTLRTADLNKPLIVVKFPSSMKVLWQVLWLGLLLTARGLGHVLWPPRASSLLFLASIPYCWWSELHLSPRLGWVKFSISTKKRIQCPNTGVTMVLCSPCPASPTLWTMRLSSGSSSPPTCNEYPQQWKIFSCLLKQFLFPSCRWVPRHIVKILKSITLCTDSKARKYYLFIYFKAAQYFQHGYRLLTTCFRNVYFYLLF